MSQFVDIFPLPLFATVPLSGFAATGSPAAATNIKPVENPAMKRILSAARARRLASLFGFGLALTALGSTAVARDTYYVNDHLATTVAAIDAAGEISALEADAFGTAVAGSDRFTGKPYDADMGAHVFPFRNYRPEEARWMSADPSGFPDGINGYASTHLPLLYVDPLGLALVNVTGSDSFSYTGAGNNYPNTYTKNATFDGKVQFSWNADQTGLVGAASLVRDPGWSGDGTTSAAQIEFKTGNFSIGTAFNVQYTANVTWFLSDASSSLEWMDYELNGKRGKRLAFDWSITLKRTVSGGPNGNVTSNVATIVMLRQWGKFE